MPGVRPTLRRGTTVLTLAAVLAVGGCGGGDVGDDYARGWDGICGNVSDAYRTFRSDASAAATRSQDPGNAAVAGGLSAPAVAADLAPAARKLQRTLREPLREAAKLQPPERWTAWNTRALRQVRRQERVLADGVRRLQTGDGDALATLALGGIGPAAIDAPTDLRDRTPACTAQR